MAKWLGRLGQSEPEWIGWLQLATLVFVMWVAWDRGYEAGVESVSTNQQHSVAVVERPVSIMDLRSSSLGGEGLSIQNLGSSVEDQYVGSSIANKYHKPTCRYARATIHAVWYRTEEEAIEAGREPCTECCR